MNTELLFQLYSIHSPSGSEKRMRKFLRKQAKRRGAQSIVTDAYGNLLITKGSAETFPCVAAHIDQVQNFHSKDFTVVQIGDDIIGWSPKCHKQQGLGADDKNGVFICLECLERFDNIKVAFFVGEETGCVGSSDVDLSFFSDCRFIIEPDRRGGSDLITSMFCGDVCSEKFVDAINASDFGYNEERGSVTDVGELVERGVGISCLNLSCGYYNAHTDEEMVILSELENCLNFVVRIIETCTDVYPFEYTPKTYASSWGSSSGFKYGNSWSNYGSLYGSYYGGGYDFCTEDDEDEEMMSELLSYEPELTFDDITSIYGINFHTRDLDHLREIYERVRVWYASDTDDDDFWGDDAKVS